LEQVYKALLGGRLITLAWMPLTNDTPGLVQAFEDRSFSFTGGIQFWFDPDGELFLSWGQRAPSTLIASTEADRWSSNALDRVSASMNGPWADAIWWDGGRGRSLPLSRWKAASSGSDSRSCSEDG